MESVVVYNILWAKSRRLRVKYTVFYTHTPYSLIYSTHNGDDAPQTNFISLKLGSETIFSMKLFVSSSRCTQMELQCLTIQRRHFPRSSLAQAIHERPLTATGQINVGFVVEELALRRIFLRILPTSHVGIIPPKHHVPISFI